MVITYRLLGRPYALCGCLSRQFTLLLSGCSDVSLGTGRRPIPVILPYVAETDGEPVTKRSWFTIAVKVGYENSISITCFLAGCRKSQLNKALSVSA